MVPSFPPRPRELAVRLGCGPCAEEQAFLSRRKQVVARALTQALQLDGDLREDEVWGLVCIGWASLGLLQPRAEWWNGLFPIQTRAGWDLPASASPCPASLSLGGIRSLITLNAEHCPRHLKLADCHAGLAFLPFSLAPWPGLGFDTGRSETYSLRAVYCSEAAPVGSSAREMSSPCKRERGGCVGYLLGGLAPSRNQSQTPQGLEGRR